MPEISVIVPVYKVEQYLRRCVDSILAQSFRDYELILVDDGSPDSCGAICNAYAAQFSHIHVIHQKNAGLSAARNAAIDWTMAHSSSRWLTFVDSDDWLAPVYLEWLYEVVQQTGCSVAACDYYITQGAVMDPGEKPEILCVSADEYYCSEQFGAVPVACAKLYRKSCFDILRYPVGKLHEDEFTTYRLIYAAEQIGVTTAKLYAYYENPNGIVHSAWNPRKLHILEAVEEQIAFAQEHGHDRMLSQVTFLYILKIHEHLQKAPAPTQRQLRKKLRRALKLGKACGVFPLARDNLWAYEEAYPAKVLWWLYFRGSALLERLPGKEDANE